MPGDKLFSQDMVRGQASIPKMENSEAVVIGRSRYSETSLIVTWCAPEAGVFRTLAKGALRPKSAFANRLDLFIGVDLGWVKSRRSDLHTLAEVDLRAPRLGLRGSYGRVLAATYFCRLIERLVEPQAPVAGLYGLLVKALDYLADKDPSAALVERFEWRVACELGVAGAADDLQRAARLLEEAFHRPLPEQRAQVLEWLRSR
jgi:DNA repair protein RecO (recombination protein O)